MIKKIVHTEGDLHCEEGGACFLTPREAAQCDYMWTLVQQIHAIHTVTAGAHKQY
jgi:hypothetical protein